MLTTKPERTTKPLGLRLGRLPAGATRQGARLLLLGVLFAQLLAAATRLSATVDEGFHITSGYEYLRTEQLQLFDEHPPLAKMLFAWPLFLVPDLVPPEMDPSYPKGDLIAVTQSTLLSYRPIDRVIVAPRVAAILVTMVFAATLVRCAALLGGPAASILALCICALDPNLLAHGSLATTDMGAAAFSFWAVWSGAEWIRRPNLQRWSSASLLLGLAQGAKLTALLVYAVLGLGVLVTAIHEFKESGARPALRRILAFVAMVAASLLVLWALYGFEVHPVSDVLGGTVPLPAAGHIQRWLRLRENLAYGRESFLLGQNSMHGWPLYFPIAFLTKTPLPILLLSTVLLSVAVSRRVGLRGARPPLSASHLTLYAFPLLYAAASLTSTLNIGYRHLLPILPFLYLSLGVGLARLSRHSVSPRLRSRVARLACLALLAWLAIGTLRSAPDYLPYFNEIAGGSENGWRFLADSNTDWGQAFKALAEHQSGEYLGPVTLSAFTFYDPAAYGVAYTPIAPMAGAPPVLGRRFNPAAGTYAISATTLDGVPLAYPPTFDWFRHREPVAKIGNAIFLYDVMPLSGSWVAQCSTPVAPLTEAAIDEGFGIQALRRLTFDCEQSWVLPAGGSTSGWYALAIPEQTALRWPSSGDSRHLDLLPQWLASLPLRDLNLSYTQPRNGELPAFGILECAECSLTAPQTPLESRGVLSYLGMTGLAEIQSGTALEVITYWEVRELPNRPLSVMLHLRATDGSLIAVGDGLGFPKEAWQVGDVFAQLHHLTIPEAAEPGAYQLHTGAYWLDDLQPLEGSAQILPTPISITP